MQRRFLLLQHRLGFDVRVRSSKHVRSDLHRQLRSQSLPRGRRRLANLRQLCGKHLPGGFFLLQYWMGRDVRSRGRFDLQSFVRLTAAKSDGVDRMIQ
jgi:hypothetical protein